MTRMNRSRGAICAAVVAGSLLAAGGHANADERPVSWDDGGASHNWTDTANWNPDTVGGPRNVGILEFLVTIGCPGVYDPVFFDALSPIEITDLFLCNDCRLILNPDTDLTVFRTGEIAGIIDARGGNFTAVGPGVCFRWIGRRDRGSELLLDGSVHGKQFHLGAHDRNGCGHLA